MSSGFVRPTARATDASPGPVAMVFGGRNTRNNIDEGRIAMIAADGDRYRILDPFTYEPPGKLAVLSPNGRYLYRGGELLDLTTGQPGAAVPGVVRAWSADGKRLVYGTADEVSGQAGIHLVAVWDFANGRILSRWTVPGESVPFGYGAALSPDGRRLALQVGRELRIYRVGEEQPERTIPLGASRLGGAAAWTPDGRGLVIARRETCTECPVSWYTRQWRLELLDPETGKPVLGHAFPTLPSVASITVLGWRTPTEPVVQLHDPAPGARDDDDTEFTVFPDPGPYTGRIVVLDTKRAGQ
ncbi:WD40 repeat domain-containing protein [Micromonospora sp. NPDC003197]